jgi:hypothetical protein
LWGVSYYQLFQDAINGNQSLRDMKAAAANQGSIVLLGDSVINTWNKEKDSFSTSVAAFLEKITQKTVINASAPGQKIPAFNQLLNYLGALTPEKYEYIIIELNPTILEWNEGFIRKHLWTMRIDYQKKRPNGLSLLLFSALSSYKQSGKPLWEINPEKKDPNEQLTKKTLAYLETKKAPCITELLSSLQALKLTCAKHGKKTIAFIPPIDLKTIGSKASQEDAIALMNRIHIYALVCDQLDIPCFDFHNLITQSEHFFDPHCVHLDETGRKRLANALAEIINSNNSALKN